jgi:hypothetical protein
LRGFSLLWLPYSGFSVVGLSVFAVVYGLDFIATLPPTVRLTARAFGAEYAPLVFGWIYASHFVSDGIMASATGAARDILASYSPAFFAAGVLCLLAVPGLVLLRDRVADLEIIGWRSKGGSRHTAQMFNGTGVGARFKDPKRDAGYD